MKQLIDMKFQLDEKSSTLFLSSVDPSSSEKRKGKRRSVSDGKDHYVKRLPKKFVEVRFLFRYFCELEDLCKENDFLKE